MTLTVGDGFKFGCGLILAAAVAGAGLVLSWAVVVFISSLLGVRLPLPGG